MKFYSKPLVEHTEVPLADDGRLEHIIAHWQDQQAPKTNTQEHTENCCYVVSVSDPDTVYAEGKLAEILGLVKAQGDAIYGHEIYRLNKPNPRTLLGTGAVRDIAERARDAGANLLVLDAALSPSQMRNLENETGFAISDREGVILNVFLRHAQTRHARIQVEIAQLAYLRPRIRGLGLNMDQQAGGVMRGRGPGETASELMARRLDERYAHLLKAANKLNKAGKCQRQQRASCLRIALLGYTNAGKTSLMNALTSAQLSARDLPFETLDTTTRRLAQQPGGDILLSDTVGFIRALPNRLLASFESTLAEVRETDLLAIVVDAADPEWLLHLETTEALLGKLHAEDIPRFYVFNKVDRLPVPPMQEQLDNVSHGHAFMALSCHHQDQVARLKAALIQAVSQQTRLSVFVPYVADQIMAKVYANCRVLETQSREQGLDFVLEGDAAMLRQIQHASEAMQL